MERNTLDLKNPDLLSFITQNILSLSQLCIIIKVADGPYLYANDIFYKIFKEFIKVKDVTNKTSAQIFLKNHQPNIKEDYSKNTDRSTDRKYQNIFNRVSLIKNRKQKDFFFIRFKVKEHPSLKKLNKKLIGYVILEIPEHFIFSNSDNSKTAIQTSEFSDLFKKIKKINNFNRKSNNQDKIKFHKLQVVIRQMEKLTHHDFLTGLYNRNAFENILKLEVKKSLRHKYPASLLVIDIDNFKKVNDNYGHISGDRILKDLAKTLTKSLRETDYVCRWGGEEFAIALIECNLEKAQEISEKLLKNVQEEKFKPMQITISIGVAQLKKNETTTTWFIRADKGLLKAKREGKNRVSIA